MKFKLHIWRQANRTAAGKMVTYDIDGIEEDMSFLEMIDVLNENLIRAGEEPVAFEHDCREGICGSCAMMINGLAHGPVVFFGDELALGNEESGSHCSGAQAGDEGEETQLPCNGQVGNEIHMAGEGRQTSVCEQVIYQYTVSCKP